LYGHQNLSQQIFYQQLATAQQQPQTTVPPSVQDRTWTFDQQLRNSKVTQLLQENIIL